jgi:hypothetical protein
MLVGYELQTVVNPVHNIHVTTGALSISRAKCSYVERGTPKLLNEEKCPVVVMQRSWQRN